MAPDMGQLTFMAPIVRKNIDWSDLDIIYRYTHGALWSFVVTAWPLGTLSCSGLETTEDRVDRAITAARLKFWNDVKSGKAEHPIPDEEETQ